MSVRTRALDILVVLMAAGLLSATAAGAVSRTTKANRQAAIRDSARLLAGVTPPPGAVVLWRRSAVGTQHRVPLLTSAFASALASERWSVPGEPGGALSYVESHLRAGSKLVSTGSGGPDPSFQSVTRSWSPVNGVLDVRWVQIEVAGQPSGGTVLSAESQSQWVVVRPGRERVPAGVTEIDVTKGLPGQPPQLSRRITAPRTVRPLVALFDSLGVVQPGAINCPEESVQPTVTVAFRATAGGPALASATADAVADFSWPDSVPGWSCFPIGFVAAGHRFDSLIGNVISPIDRLLHVRVEAHR